MKKTAAADVVIVGGGILGLWLLARLRKSALSVILLESNALGSGQTGKSQGIIHGGLKYALQGKLTAEANVLSSTPDYWQACLQGRGEIDLSRVPILSQQQYLWSPSKFTSKLTGFLAGATLQSKVSTLPRELYPAVFRHPGFRGEVYALNELVLDVPALTRELLRDNQDAVFKIEPLSEHELSFDAENNLQTATVYQAGKALEISAQHFIFASGSGNEVLMHALPQNNVAMQRRPLHMVLVKTPFNFPLYAHCLGLSKRPRITITTHYTQEGEPVWYLGGMLAETGVSLDAHKQEQATRQELRQLFSWLDFSSAEIASFKIDRAEHLQVGGLKPEGSFSKTMNNVTVAWPTKLALAPELANSISMELTTKLQPRFLDLRELRVWPIPPLAIPVWEEAFCKSVA